MRKALKVCPCIGCAAHPGSCPELVQAGRCTRCGSAADHARGTATQRGYNSSGHQAFRRAVLRRDPTCVACGTVRSTVADHYPLSRRDLVAAGLDPDDPSRGRGLCTPCHGTATAKHQPGGWNIR